MKLHRLCGVAERFDAHFHAARDLAAVERYFIGADRAERARGRGELRNRVTTRVTSHEPLLRLMRAPASDNRLATVDVGAGDFYAMRHWRRQVTCARRPASVTGLYHLQCGNESGLSESYLRAVRRWIALAVEVTWLFTAGEAFVTTDRARCESNS